MNGSHMNARVLDEISGPDRGNSEAGKFSIYMWTQGWKDHGCYLMAGEPPAACFSTAWCFRPVANAGDGGGTGALRDAQGTSKFNVSYLVRWMTRHDMYSR
jgi:hypothetical protein